MDKIKYDNIAELPWNPEIEPSQSVFVMIKPDLIKYLLPNISNLEGNDVIIFFRHIFQDFLHTIYPSLKGRVDLDKAWILDNGLTMTELEDLYKDSYMKWIAANKDTLSEAELEARYEWYTNEPMIAMEITLPAPTESEAVRVMTDIRERLRAYWSDTDSSKVYFANEHFIEDLNGNPIKYHPIHNSVLNALHVSSKSEAKVFLENRSLI